VNRFEIGIQMWPWYDIKTLLVYAERALEKFPFEQVWMCDEFQYEDSFTVLAAMAMRLNVSVGTMVTFPHRNPMELAQRFSGIAGLIKEGREVSAGIGAGGAVQEQVVNEKTAPMAVMEETTRFLKTLFAGESADLNSYPRLSARFRYNPRTKAKLYFPPLPKVPVYLAAGGPKMFDMAGRLGDGVILTQLNPWTSLPGIQRGMFKQAVQKVTEARQAAATDGAFKKIYNLHISVSADGDKARQWAKRNTSYALAGSLGRYPDVLQSTGVDLKDVERVREAYVNGLGVDEAAKRVSDKLLQDAGFIVAGTPKEVLAKCEAILPLVREAGIDQFVIGVPLGPNVPEALGLLAEEIIPALR
jgi:alkanesulfonate monooxygenase SsuD/methylene tetrahydromethanopterin reductase-like flavin-dependent oxidoreductase (luciferase family)